MGGSNAEGPLGHGQHFTERICSGLYAHLQVVDNFFFHIFFSPGMGMPGAKAALP